MSCPCSRKSHSEKIRPNQQDPNRTCDLASCNKLLANNYRSNFLLTSHSHLSADVPPPCQCEWVGYGFLLRSYSLLCKSHVPLIASGTTLAAQGGTVTSIRQASILWIKQNISSPTIECIARTETKFAWRTLQFPSCRRGAAKFFKVCGLCTISRAPVQASSLNSNSEPRTHEQSQSFPRQYDADIRSRILYITL